MKIKIVEVGPRDGLQNESEILSLNDRYEFIKKLSQTGLQYIEAGAFVSPKWVPQMNKSGELYKKIKNSQKKGMLPNKVHYPMLVPNMFGLEKALQAGVKEIAVFGAASESFSKKNINCSISESLKRFKKVVEGAHKKKMKVRAYLSMSFGCPYEGNVSKTKVVNIIKKLLDMGIYEVSIGDTIGVATPKQVRELLKMIKSKKEIPLNKIAMHFHDTRGTALANVLSSLDEGIRIFDSSLGGLGGCPYAKGASGNLATEDLVYMLEGMGYKTKIDIDKLKKINKWIEKKVKHPLPSHVGRT